MASRIILFTGLAGDSRLLAPLKLSGNLLTPNYVEPSEAESLVDYARRLAEIHRIGKDDIIGGSSFGGMIAGQISAMQDVAGVILLGSCLQPRKLPRSYRWLERVNSVIPDFLLAARSWGPIIRHRFAPITPEGEACLRAMAKDCPALRIRRFGKMLMTWSGVAKPRCPSLSIHGDRDRIIPASCAEFDVLLKDAGHCFTLTHVEQTARLIEEFRATIN